jgi:hypothetical protein
LLEDVSGLGDIAGLKGFSKFLGCCQYSLRSRKLYWDGAKEVASWTSAARMLLFFQKNHRAAA